MQFDHNKESNDNLFYKFRYLQGYVCQSVLESDSLAHQKKYAACLFSHVSPKARACFSKMSKPLESAEMSKEDEAKIDACFHELTDEVKQIGQRLQYVPDFTKYIVKVNAVQEYPHFYQQVLDAPKTHCSQERAMLDACLSKNKDAAQCYKEQLVYDICFSSTVCAQPLRNCLAGKTDSTSLVHCINGDAQTSECIGEATRIEMVHKAQTKYAQVAKQSTFDALQATGPQMDELHKQKCATEVQQMQACVKEGKMCYQERMNLVFCGVASICGMYIAACMQKGNSFDACMDDATVQKCTQHMQKE